MTKRFIPSLAAIVLATGAILVPTATATANAEAGRGSPENCADTPMATLGDLRNAITNAGEAGSGVVFLGAGAALPADGSGIAIPPGSPIMLDLCGGSLTISTWPTAVHVPTGANLTVTDSIGGGTLTAEVTDVYGGAAIGGGVGEDAGTITIEGGSVTARVAHYSGAAVGGGYGGHGSDATGNTRAGTGGTGGSGGVVTVNGGTLTAVTTGIYSGAAIGGGFGGLGGQDTSDPALSGDGGTGGAGGTLILNGGTVTAVGHEGGFGPTAIGGGSGGFGHIVEGVSGAGADIVVNGGVLNARSRYLPIGSGVTVTTADGAPGTLKVAGDWIAGVTPVTLPHAGWDPAPVPMIAPSGGPKRFQVVNGTSGDSLTTRIEFVDALVDVRASSGTAKPGDTITVSALARVPSGATFDVSSALQLSSSVAEDVISGNAVTFTHASPHVITVSYGGISTTLAIEVDGPSLAATGTEFTLWPVAGIGLVALGAALVIQTRRRSRLD